MLGSDNTCNEKTGCALIVDSKRRVPEQYFQRGLRSASDIAPDIMDYGLYRMDRASQTPFISHGYIS